MRIFRDPLQPFTRWFVAVGMLAVVGGSVAALHVHTLISWQLCSGAIGLGLASSVGAVISDVSTSRKIRKMRQEMGLK